MPPWNRPNRPATTYSETRPLNGRNSSSATPCSTEPSSSVRRPPMRSEIQPEASRLTTPSRRASATASPRRAPRRSRGRRNRRRCAPAASTWPRSRKRRPRTAAPARVPGLMPMGRSEARGLRPAAGPRPAPRHGPAGAAASTSASGSMVSHAEHAHADVGLAPADAVDEVLHHRRPHRAGGVVAAHADRQRDAAPAVEPLRGVGHQRREGGRSRRAGRSAGPAPRRTATGWAPARRR